jgi:hypothetical protein
MNNYGKWNETVSKIRNKVKPYHEKHNETCRNAGVKKDHTELIQVILATETVVK